jgi:cyclase
MKIRVIPIVLTDGVTVVKGERFNNWRTVGDVFTLARLHSARDVDELVFLDTTATRTKRGPNYEMIEIFSELLGTPFSYGGGISSLSEAQKCISSGAEKIVIGRAALENEELIEELALEFGSQAVVVAVNVSNDEGQLLDSKVNQGHQVNAKTFALQMQDKGAGELIVQSISHDGLMCGYPLKTIESVSSAATIPVIASTGAGSLLDFELAVMHGAAAVAAGAFFQFTQFTPEDVRDHLSTKGFLMRQTY